MTKSGFLFHWLRNCVTDHLVQVPSASTQREKRNHINCSTLKSSIQTLKYSNEIVIQSIGVNTIYVHIVTKVNKMKKQKNKLHCSKKPAQRKFSLCLSMWAANMTCTKISISNTAYVHTHARTHYNRIRSNKKKVALLKRK